jgi:two-component system phosphate regulon sensor histidine kinase PhoR
MRHKRLLWQLYPSYLIVIVLSLWAIGWFASHAYKQFSLRQAAANLQVRGRMARIRLAEPLESGDTTGVQSACQQMASLSATRVTLILPSGKVICDSEEDPAQMDNHADRPEVIEAMKSGRGQAVRYSHTLGQNMIYVAIPIKSENRMLALMRTSMPITDIEDALSEVYVRITIGGVIIALVAAVVSFFVARRVTRQLEEVRLGAMRFASGELQHKLPVSPVREIGGVAEAMNSMAAQLHERLQAIVRQRNEQEAVLASMIEGVLAVDTEERVIGLNRAAAQLFQISPDKAQGRTVQEIVRNPALIEFVGRVLSTRTSAEAEVTFYDKAPRYLQAHGTVLADAGGKSIGVLVVLNDVTRIRRLESVRRDFVANVSHELKTPVTSIKGFVETLLDGAIDDPEKGRRFTGIIARQADRLQAIIEDLLTLSRLEQDAEEAQIPMKSAPLRPVIDGAVQACEVKAREKNIEFKIDCPSDLTLRMNAALLEQAIVNLIDNAVKYNDPGGKVEVTVEVRPDRVVISVTDHGPGVSEEHLPRLFERFYRVDKARSRTLGGTGLGLSIVKHIAQVHGGYPEVKSVLGEGCTFMIHLPTDGPLKATEANEI